MLSVSNGVKIAKIALKQEIRNVAFFICPLSCLRYAHRYAKIIAKIKSNLQGKYINAQTFKVPSRLSAKNRIRPHLQAYRSRVRAVYAHCCGVDNRQRNSHGQKRRFFGAYLRRFDYSRAGHIRACVLAYGAVFRVARFTGLRHEPAQRFVRAHQHVFLHRT